MFVDKMICGLTIHCFSRIHKPREPHLCLIRKTDLKRSFYLRSLLTGLPASPWQNCTGLRFALSLSRLNYNGLYLGILYGFCMCLFKINNIYNRVD